MELITFMQISVIHFSYFWTKLSGQRGIVGKISLFMSSSELLILLILYFCHESLGNAWNLGRSGQMAGRLA